MLLTTKRGLMTAAAPRSLALKRTAMSWLKSASLLLGDWATVIASTVTRSFHRLMRASTLWEKPTFSGACSASQRSCSAKACLGLK